MQDKQNKGIGSYKDRPGYFWGGMVGGAILGALVNKMQGKDWKRGAMWGGIGGGLGSAFLGGTGWSGASALKTAPFTSVTPSWISKMAPGITKSLATWGAGNPHLAGAVMGGGAAWMAGDPDKEREDAERYRREQFIARYNRNKSQYGKWYTNPWTGEEMNPHLGGYNTGGAISARPGYYNGGGAWSDVPGDEEVPGSYEDRVLSITGQGGTEGLGGLEDIMETFEMSSNPGVGSEAFQVYESYLMNNNLTKEQLPFETFIEMWRETAQADPQTQGRFPLIGGEMAAQGGYKTRPGYADAGPVDMPYDPEGYPHQQYRPDYDTFTGLADRDEGYTADAGMDYTNEVLPVRKTPIHPTIPLPSRSFNLQDWIDSFANEEEAYEAYKKYEKMLIEGFRYKGHPMGGREDDLYDEKIRMLDDPEEEDKTYWERIIEKLRASEMLNTPNRVGRTAIDEWEQSEFNTAKWLQKIPVLRDIMDKEIEAAAHKRPMAYRAEGGIADLDMTGGGASFGPGTGTSDDIPAMLSDGEFVVTANAVKNLGGGDRMLGAKRMYQMMNQLDPNSQTPAEMNTVGIA